MPPQQEFTTQTLLERVQAVWMGLSQDRTFLSKPQRTSIQKSSVLIGINRDSIHRNPSKKRSHTILSDIWEHSQDLFVLCALATGPWQLSHLRSTDYLQVLLTWWSGVDHHDLAGVLRARYPDIFPRDGDVAVTRSHLPDPDVTANKNLRTPALSSASVEDEMPPNKRPRTSPMTDNSSTLPIKETQGELTAVHGSSLHLPVGQKQRVFENASLQGITKVFNKYVCDAVRRVTSEGDLKCAVTMVFPVWAGSVDSLMSLDVYERDVEQLAMTLFNAKVKWVDQVLHIVFKEGLTVITHNFETILKGASDQAIEEVFGSEVLDAITESPVRKRELAGGKRVTECVSMIFTKNGAIINLSLGLKGGLQIQNELYK